MNARHGAKSLQPASEGYSLDRSAPGSPNGAVLHAPTHPYCLHLWSVPAALYIIPETSLRSCAALTGSEPPADPVDRAVRLLLAHLPLVTVNACVKGRFHDRLMNKLDQVGRGSGNEVVAVDLAAVAAALAP